MTYSILLTSRNRKEELQRFVESLNKQSEFDLSKIQLIFVDQEDNKSIFDMLNPKVEFLYIKYHECSLSEARNQALPYANKEIICFGDDDAWYDDNTFSKLEKVFKESYDGIIAIAKNEEDRNINIFPVKRQKLTYTNHCGALSISIFLRFDPEIKFDENIGVGSSHKLLSGEETDYLLTYMERHPSFDIEFIPEVIVRHPLGMKQNFDNYLLKNYYYARGAGYVLRKHRMPIKHILSAFFRPLGGIIIYSFINHYKSKKSYYLLKGRIEGYFYNN